MLNIRCLSHHHVELIKQQRRHQSKCSFVETLDSNALYFKIFLISNTEKTCVLLPVDNWFKVHWPKLSSCAWSILEHQDLLKIFTSEIEGQYFFSGKFHCEHAEIITGSQSSQQSWLNVNEPELGIVLLDNATGFLGKSIEQPARWGNLLMPVDWVVGYSYISVQLLRTLELHDVFCIQNVQLNMLVTGRKVARFKKLQEGQFVIEENVMAEAVDTELLDEMLESESLGHMDMANITVKLTFVLGQSSITLDELSHTQVGSIYTIGANSEREVKVYANKQLIAEGELVYIGNDGDLGLEITKLAHLGSIEQ